MDAREDTVSRFREACRREELIVAAFLGGSLAAGTADEASDVDIYAVTGAADYELFFARRVAFVHAWARPLLLLETLNFEGLGFDMLHFVLEDGVCGELALGHSANFPVMHGGPHRVLVDKTGLLDGVTFTPHAPSASERRQQAERALNWFWLDLIQFRKQLYRRHLVAMAAQLARLRAHCSQLLAVARTENIGVDVDAQSHRLEATLEISDPAEAAHAIGQLHRDVGSRIASHLGLRYPTDAATLLGE
jgi:nucleotidyltransferase-like protein